MKIIVLSSVTYALRAVDILKENSIPANLTRSSAVKKIRGCGYGVAVKAENYEKTLSLLSENGIKIIGETEEKR